MPQANIDTAHAEIAREIRLAKKRMFKAHRSGTPLFAARDAFIAEIESVITEQDSQLRGTPPKDVGATAAEDAPETASDVSTGDTGKPFPKLQTKLEHCPESLELIESLAAQCLQDGDTGQQLALLELLTYIMDDHSGGWSITARNAVISASGELRDEAADLLVAQAQQKRFDARGR